ncbi:MAG: helix-turn-helix domain-containing protein [Gemmataceae bacterium]|nr:helix-turn-helix domain-containing protein [Gemmataceae bacterium]
MTTNYMGEWFWGRRAERHWSLAEVAVRLGYANVSKCCNKVLRVEREGVADDGFLQRLAAVLEISEGVIRYLTRQDRNSYLRAWQEWSDQPMPLRVVVRAVPGFMMEVAIPHDVTTEDAAVAFGQFYAARHHAKVFVVLNRRESVGITEAGDINGRFDTRPDTDPNPLVGVRRQKFLFRTGGFGAIEPYVPARGTA